ncbi:hypothetical protein EV363DRAFT_1188185 [Boletus edulis]|nr:hypothetical protein EV363DRAFT_1188185 [Boletus edulis]
MLPPPPVSKSVPLTFKKATIKTMVHRDKHPSSTHTSAPDQPRRRGRYSKNQKDAIQPKPSHIGFYPKLWQQLLEIAKAEMRRALFLHQPFLPDRKTAIKGECYEVLLGVIARYEREQRPVECGYSDWKANMAEMLYDDVTSFRSVLKKAVQEAVPSGYALHAPPTAISREARTMFLKDRATQLLQDSEYLLGDVNEQGKKLLFGHPVLKQVCLYVYYSNTSKSLRTFGEFQRSVPKKALALVAAMVHFVLTLYKKHGRDTNPSLSSKELEDTYKKIMCGMDKLATHRSKGYRFEVMLTQWAAEGMDGFSNGVGDESDAGNEFGMNISDSEPEPALNEHLGDEDFGAPLGMDFGTSTGTDFGTPIGADFGTSIGADFGTPIGADVGTPIGADFGAPIGADGDEHEDFGPPASGDNNEHEQRSDAGFSDGENYNGGRFGDDHLSDEHTNDEGFHGGWQGFEGVDEGGDSGIDDDEY